MKVTLLSAVIATIPLINQASAACLQGKCVQINAFVECAKIVVEVKNAAKKPKATTSASVPVASPTVQAVVYEAENAVLNGVTVVNSSPGYSGTGYVGNFANDADSVKFIIPSDTAGLFNLQVQYQSPYGFKNTRMVVNGGSSAEIAFQQTDKFTLADAGKVLLQPGNNTIEFQRDWGWYFIDSLQVRPAARRPDHNVNPCLTNTASTKETWDLWSLKLNYYGKKILSGQQDPAMLSWMEDYVGRDPAIVGFDMIDYSPTRASHRINSTTVEDAIAWDQRGGIVDFCWHWNAPVGLYDTPGHEWWRGFYTIGTDFNLTTALNPNNANYTLLIRDMDVIASKLVKLRDAKVPVVWRPLHEAEGGWFWWGAQGPEAAKTLYRLMYDRYTNYWGLNNLIWVWNSVNPSWYPGDQYVDIVSFDNYPQAGDHGVQDNQFSALISLGNDKKLIAMAENGPIPDPALMPVYQADWSYFVTWGNEFLQDGKQNSLSFLQYVFNHTNVLTLDQIAGWKRGWKMPKTAPWVMQARLSPAPSPSATAAPTATATAALSYPIPSPTLVVHRGGDYSNGFQSWSWSVDINTNDVSVAVPQMDGVTSAISVAVTSSWGALRLHAPTSFLGYQTVHFQAQGSPNFNFWVGTDATSSPMIPLSMACTPAVSVGAWSECSVDIQAFGSATQWVYLGWQASTEALDSFSIADLYLDGQAVF